METLPEPLAARFEAAGQSHVFAFWGRLDGAARERLRAQAEAIDVEAVRAGFEEARVPHPVDPASLEPVDALSCEAAAPGATARRERGEALLAEGRGAVVTVAGGQGTRLGFDGPKGSFPLGPVSGRSLFGLFAQRLAGLGRRYGAAPPWWIMTSPATDAPTRRFFAENDHFGLDPGGVAFVVQGTLPVLDLEGRLLLEAPDRIAEAPDGHGGLFEALQGAGALEALEARGAEALFYHHVDNPLARLADPEYLGFHVERGAEMSCKAVEKTDPLEKAGFLCQLAGRTAIVEYSEIPAALAAAREPGGRLRHWAGSIGVHVFDPGFVRRVAEGPPLPLHLARKAIPTVDSEGRTLRPSEPNGYKIERFVFDALARARGVAVMETRRGDEYSPVKNARGESSPETARRDLQRCYRRWIEAAGLSPPGETVEIEMDHSRFDGPEDLRRSGLRDIADAAPFIRLAHGAQR